MDSTPGWNRIDDRDIDGDQEENRKSRIKRKQTGDRKNTVSYFYFLNIENNDIRYKSERSV